jgi:hypothetical protein
VTGGLYAAVLRVAGQSGQRDAVPELRRRGTVSRRRSATRPAAAIEEEWLIEAFGTTLEQLRVAPDHPR